MMACLKHLWNSCKCDVDLLFMLREKLCMCEVMTSELPCLHVPTQGVYVSW